MSSWTKLWVVSWASDNVCLFPSLPQSSSFTGRSPSPGPVSTPHFVSTLSYTSPVTWHHTSWLLSSLPLSFDSIPTLSRWGRGGGHSMPLMWPWPHVPPACQADPGAMGSQLHPGWLMAGVPSPLTLHAPPTHPPPGFGEQHSVSWAHLCGAQELHLKSRQHFYLVPHDSLGGHKACVTPPPSLPSPQPHLHGSLQCPHCIITVSMLNPLDSQTNTYQSTRIALFFRSS